MKTYISLFLLFSFLLSFCGVVAAVEPSEIAIADIAPPVPGSAPMLSLDEPKDYKIVTQAWFEYREEEISKVCISGSDSFFTEAYIDFPLLERFESGLHYRYVLILTPKDRIPFASAPSLRLCGESVRGTLLADDPMYCVYETAFLCQSTAVNAPVQITVKAPVVGSLAENNAEISNGYTITEMKWFDDKGKTLNDCFQAETDYTVRIRFQKNDESSFDARPNVSINGQEPQSLVLTHANLCTVQFKFPQTLHIQELVPPTAGAKPQFITDTQYGSYYISYQEWQEFTPGGFIGRRCVPDADGNPASVGSAALLTEFIPGFTYNLHITLRRCDGGKMTQCIPLLVGGRNARASLSKGDMLTQTAFTVPFDFAVSEPIAGAAPSFSNFYSEQYIVTEAWMQLDDNGNTVQYITNDEKLNASIPLLTQLTQFKQGKRYTYAVDITSKQGYPLSFVPEGFVNGLELHAGLYNDAVTLGYQRSFECSNVDKNVQFSHTLSLHNDISINFLARQEQLADYDSYYLECTLPVYEGNVKTGETRITVEPIEQNGLCYFTVNRVSAKQMNDEINAVIHMTKDGIEYTSRTDTYSIAEYAYYMLNKQDASDSLKALCANLLRYGAQAQTWFSYRTDVPADAAMTERHKSYLIEFSDISLTDHMQIMSDLDTQSIKWNSASLILESRVILKFFVDLSNFKGSMQNLRAKISYKDLNGTLQTLYMSNFILIDPSKGLYSIECDFLAAKDLRSVLTVALYDGETQCSQSVCYSVESYACRQQGAILPLCKALIAYSDAAKHYFLHT